MERTEHLFGYGEFFPRDLLDEEFPAGCLIEHLPLILNLVAAHGDSFEQGLNLRKGEWIVFESCSVVDELRKDLFCSKAGPSNLFVELNRFFYLRENPPIPMKSQMRS